MDALFLWIEETALSTWIRESTSVFAFPAILSAHAIGMGLAAGINSVYALRVLGAAAPAVPPEALRRFEPLMWFGFWLNAASGLLLLIAYPTKALTNPVFYVKLALIALAMWLFFAIRRQIVSHTVASHVETANFTAALEAGTATPQTLKMFAGAALVCWAGAITAGRLLAYTYDRLLASW